MRTLLVFVLIRNGFYLRAVHDYSRAEAQARADVQSPGALVIGPVSPRNPRAAAAYLRSGSAR
jgi:hypothetical protein